MLRLSPRVSLSLALAIAASLAALTACGEDDLGEIITDVNEVHYQGGGKVDLLFVVDSSGSMEEEQAALGDGFDAFMDTFLELEYDFRVAITDMDYETHRGTFLGSPPVITPETADLVEVFRANAQVGTFGSGTEKGFESARAALSDAKLETVNEGFFREEALLAIIFVSDEDDQSGSADEDYLQFFLDRKLGDARRLKVSAIAGDVPDGCDTAMAGTRYAAMAEATGGSFHSICAEDLGMPELGRLLSGYKTRFVLSGSPVDESQITVAVDGEVVEPGPDTWSLDEEGAVAFVAGAVPTDCAEVQFAYRTRDPVSTGGEPLVVETEAPICANNRFPSVELPERGCAQVGGTSTPSLLALFALVLGWLVPRRRR
jgi:uncharacterized protein (TIGR03382 family)